MIAMFPHQVVVMVDVDSKRVKSFPIMRAVWFSHVTRSLDRVKTSQWKREISRSGRDLRDKRRKYVSSIRPLHDAIIHLRFISNLGLEKRGRSQAIWLWRGHQKQILKLKVGTSLRISSYLFILLQPLLF